MKTFKELVSGDNIFIISINQSQRQLNFRTVKYSLDIEDSAASDRGQHHGATAGTDRHRHRRSPGRQGVYRRCGCGRDDV